ncbi:MAG: hypothetical protein C0P63_018360, partial [Actinomycetales bacterium]
YSSDRYGTEYSTLSSSMSVNATSMSVSTSVGPLWTTALGDFPLDVMVGGERMRVTRITGTSSPQTFTVTRSINGIKKSHSPGEPVTLFKPAIRAL